MKRIPTIHKKTFLQLTTTELALTSNQAYHDLEYGKYKTVNIVIKKDGRRFNMILITSPSDLTKEEIIKTLEIELRRLK